MYWNLVLCYCILKHWPGHVILKHWAGHVNSSFVSTLLVILQFELAMWPCCRACASRNARHWYDTVVVHVPSHVTMSCYLGRPATTTKTLICPGWETAVVPVSQPGTPVRDKRGCPFIPGLATARLVTPTGTKGAASAHVAGAPFCPGWCYQPGQNVSFFHVFLFSILFLFQLYFCISIKLMYWNSVCMISTNIYIYI